MGLLNSLSLRNRFLIVPFIGVILTLVIYITNTAIIQSHSNLFDELKQSNLPQVSEISRVAVLLTSGHTKLTDLLAFAESSPDEERIYLQGRDILNDLHDLESQLDDNLGATHKIIIDKVDIFEQIKLGFHRYRDETISAIELSTVDPKLANAVLHKANVVLQQLNDTFLILSQHYVSDLTEKARLIEGSYAANNIATLVSIAVLMVMVVVALILSRRMTADLEHVNQALIGLSEGRMDIQLPEQADGYMQQLYKAVYEFKQTIHKNREQREHLSHTIEELTDSKERYFNLLNVTATAIITINKAHEIVLFNKAAERMFGYQQQEMLGKSIELLIPEKYHQQHQVNIDKFGASDAEVVPAMQRQPISALRKNGNQFYIEANIAKLELANENLMTAAITDITERLQAEEKILHQAHFDTLTKLPNRFLSLDRLSQQLREAQRNEELVAVLFLDLDDFKKINDSLGHETGDKVLIEAANRLSRSVRGVDTVGRLGGDEFIIILPGLNDVTDVRPIASNLVKQFREAFKIEDRELILTASIGISIYPIDGDNASELLRNADSAMYNAKDLGRNTFSFFTETMNKEISRRLMLEEQMHGALDRDEFYLLYQPQLDIQSGKIYGTEALLRWRNPVLGEVYPDEFITVAEQTGLIVPIGQFVLSTALVMASQWQQGREDGFRIAVNLSPRQFHDPGLVTFIEQAVQQSGVSPGSLELEITEGVLMSGHAYIDDALDALSVLGVGMAMDDFGTGYSSMSYLRQYSFDTLKIDRSFVNDITVSKADRELVNATIAMAHSLGLKVVAEGVETKAQLQHLAKQGCEFAQGYYFSKPVPPQEITEMLKKSGLGPEKSGSKPTCKLHD